MYCESHTTATDPRSPYEKTVGISPAESIRSSYQRHYDEVIRPANVKSLFIMLSIVTAGYFLFGKILRLKGY